MLAVIMSRRLTTITRQQNTTKPRSSKKAAHHAYLAHGHNQHAMHHDAEAAKLHTEHSDSLVKPASEKKGAA
jgi:hypothetical protein